MPKNTLTALQIKAAGDGKHHDGEGLILVKNGESGKWLFRYSHLGKRREMGLGRWPAISLAEARKARDSWQAALAAGKDPIAEREAQRDAERAQREANHPTFKELTLQVFEARKDSLRGEGKRGRWLSPLERHVFPKIGDRIAKDLTRRDFADALRPIWRTKHPTAIKAFRRIHIVIKEGRFSNSSGDPFEVEAAKRLLGDVHHEEENISATPWQEIPALWQRIGTSVADDCLRLMLLTLVRSDGCRRARIEEFADGLWIVPKDRIKGRKNQVKDFRVPLSAEAQRIVDRLSPVAEPYLFSAKPGQPISDRAVEKRMDVMKESGRPHGFRTSFRTWVQDTDACTWDISEAVLGHSIGGKVQRAYARSDQLERRRIVMEAWAAHVTGGVSNVVSLPQRV